MRNRIIAILGVMLSQISNANSAFANAIEFHADKAIYAGNGCPLGSTAISVDEFGDLNIEHSALAILLEAYGEDQALAQRKTCIIRVPVKIPHGLYVKSVQQTLSYGVAKSAGADIELASKTSIAGDAVSPLLVSLPEGEEYYIENALDSRVSHLDSARQRAKYCSDTRAEETMLQMQVTLSGQRESIAEDMLVAAYGQHVGEGIEIELGNCP